MWSQRSTGKEAWQWVIYPAGPLDVSHPRLCQSFILFSYDLWPFDHKTASLRALLVGIPSCCCCPLDAGGMQEGRERQGTKVRAVSGDSLRAQIQSFQPDSVSLLAAWDRSPRDGSQAPGMAVKGVRRAAFGCLGRESREPEGSSWAPGMGVRGQMRIAIPPFL